MLQDTIYSMPPPEPSRVDWTTIVAAIAVIVAFVSQVVTLIVTDRRAAQAVETANRQVAVALSATRAQFVADQLRHTSERLYEDLAEYLSNSYLVDSGYRASKVPGGEPWPGDRFDIAMKEDLLFNKVRLRLNPDAPEEMALLKRLRELRDIDGAIAEDEVWLIRRDRVVAAAQDVTAARRKEIATDLSGGVDEGAKATVRARASRFSRSLRNREG